MFNAHWLTYFDDTCTRFMESLGFGEDFWVNEFDVMLVKAMLEWSGPAQFDDWIDIAGRAGAARHQVVRPEFTATVEGRSACAATITYVAVVPGRNTSVPLSDDVRDALTLRLV